MLDTWLSKERLLSNSTHRFLTDDEEPTEQPSSIRQCSISTDRLHHSCLLFTSKLVCGGRSGALWLPSHHPGGH